MFKNLTHSGIRFIIKIDEKLNIVRAPLAKKQSAILGEYLRGKITTNMALFSLK